MRNFKQLLIKKKIIAKLKENITMMKSSDRKDELNEIIKISEKEMEMHRIKNIYIYFFLTCIKCFKLMLKYMKKTVFMQ